jgi:hypothetical protein
MLRLLLLNSSSYWTKPSLSYFLDQKDLGRECAFV